MLKIAVVGAGHLGKIHLKLLKQSERYELVGFHDVDAENSKKLEIELGYKYFSDFDEMLTQIDCLDIVTPTFAHLDYAVKAIKTKKHFFIEKPITKDIKEAKEIIALAKENKVLGQVGHVERFNPAFTAAQDLIHNPLFLEVHRLAEFNPRGTDVPVVLDLMIHDLDIILSLIDSPIKRIDASGVAVVSQTADIANARIEFENGCVANITTSRISMKNMRKSRFFQKDAYISVDFLEKKAEVIKMEDAPAQTGDFDMIIENAEGNKKKITFDYPKVEESNAILCELESLADSIEKGTPVRVTLEQATQALEVALEITDQIDNIIAKQQ